MQFARACAIAATLAVLAAATSADAAEDKPSDPATPPVSLEKRCITDISGFTHKGKTITFVFQLQNICEQRLKCVVNAYVVSAFGAKQGHKTLVLAPKSDGARSKRSMTFRVKSDSGGTYRAHTCRQA